MNKGHALTLSLILSCYAILLKAIILETPGKIIDLSLNGIKYATLLPDTDTEKLYQKLYSYNTIPIPLTGRTTSWDSSSIFPAGNFYAGSRTLMENYWVPVTSSKDTSYWLSWAPKNGQIQKISPAACTFKLYISPHVDDYLPVLFEVVKSLIQSRTYCFKTGSNYHGVSRPDKIVAYFESFEDLQNAAQKIYDHTRNFRAHGVPFSAPVFDTLMLSWGIDPPAGKKKEPVSWRVWITKVLAAGITEGKKMLVEEPGLYALQYMRDKGFDTNTWAPDPALFYAE